MSELKRTPLYPEYEALGAKTVDFGGWDMPVQFSGIKQENCTGISQPPKSTVFAPNASYSGYNGVLFSSLIFQSTPLRILKSKKIEIFTVPQEISVHQPESCVTTERLLLASWVVYIQVNALQSCVPQESSLPERFAICLLLRRYFYLVHDKVNSPLVIIRFIKF